MTPEITCVKLITLHQLYKCCRSHFLNIYAPVTIKVHQAQVQRESLDNCSNKKKATARVVGLKFVPKMRRKSLEGSNTSKCKWRCFQK